LSSSTADLARLSISMLFSDAPSLLLLLPLPSLFEGDHSPNDYTISKKDGGSSKEAKGVQNLARNMLKQSNNVLDSSLENWLGLGCLLEQASKEIISAHFTPLNLKMLAFK